MYSQFLVKKAVFGLDRSYMSPYTQALGQQPQMQQAEMPIGFQEMLASLMMRPSSMPKKQNNFYDYIMANPDKVSDAMKWEEFQRTKPEYAEKMKSTRNALLDSSGKGLFNPRNDYKGSIDPKILRDAFLAEPRMDNKIAMLEALKRDSNPEFKEAIQMIQKSNLVDPSQRERWWRFEPGKQSVSGNIQRVRGVDPSQIAGTPQYEGGGAQTWGPRAFNKMFLLDPKQRARDANKWLKINDDANKWLNQRNSPGKREKLRQSRTPVTASYNPYSTPPSPTTFNPTPQNTQIGYNPYNKLNTGYNTNLPGAIA